MLINNMNVFIIIKCGFQDSFFFISQIANVKRIKKVIVFRDSKTLSNPMVEYVVPKIFINSILKNVIRLMQIVRRKHLQPKAIVGIYEIPHGLLAVIAGKILKVPSIVSIIGNPAFTKLRQGYRMKLTMWIMKNANYITVTGNNSKRFIASKGIPVDKIFILPNSIDFNSFKHNHNTKKIYDIISLGRISQEKHIEIIVEVIDKLSKKNPNITAAIAGSGPELENIKNLIKEFNLEQNITILGFIPDESLEKFFNSGRIFVLPSETEGFPRTIIQAASCGIPVVSTDVGDISDIITDGEDGFLIDGFDNVDIFSNKINQLLSDEFLRNKFSSKLKTKVQLKLSHEKASDVWNKILGGYN